MNGRRFQVRVFWGQSRTRLSGSLFPSPTFLPFHSDPSMGLFFPPLPPPSCSLLVFQSGTKTGGGGMHTLLSYQPSIAKKYIPSCLLTILYFDVLERMLFPHFHVRYTLPHSSSCSKSRPGNPFPFQSFPLLPQSDAHHSVWLPRLALLAG